MNEQLAALNKLNAVLPQEPACAGSPESFFPDSELEKSVRWLRNVCLNCPAMTACREYALEWESEGVWGGTTPLERLKLNPERQRHLRRVNRSTSQTDAEVPAVSA